MAKPSDTWWDIDSHSLAKHRILRLYLEAWLPILGTTHPRLRVVDGFAGPGRYVKGEPGSPVIAMKAFLEHASRSRITADIEYVFIEERRDRYEALLGEVDRLKQESPLPPGVSVDTRHGAFDQEMDVLARGSQPPTFAFIDPFGWTGAPMHLTSRIIGIDHCEALVYVPMPFIARFVSDPKVEQSLNLLFGGESWKVARGQAQDRKLRSLHVCFRTEMLRHCHYVRFRSFEIRPDGSRGYTLFFGTRHPLGLEKMKAVMWKLDPGGGCVFTDSTSPGQEVLFQREPDYAQLGRMLRGHFGQGEFTIDEAEQYVLVDTPFAKSHVRRSLRPVEASGGLSVPRARAGRRRGAYPVGTALRFDQ
jgi:three-Cys-motif partner protein